MYYLIVYFVGVIITYVIITRNEKALFLDSHFYDNEQGFKIALKFVGSILWPVELVLIVLKMIKYIIIYLDSKLTRKQ